MKFIRNIHYRDENEPSLAIFQKISELSAKYLKDYLKNSKALKNEMTILLEVFEE